MQIESASQNFDLGCVYGEIRDSLVRYAAHYFNKSYEVEDVVQESFVKVLEIQRKQRIRSPEAYLFRTTRNLAINAQVKCANRLTDLFGDRIPDSVLLKVRSVEDQFESKQEFESFCSAVKELPTKCRQVFVMRRVYGFARKEIAAELGISIKTVEAHLTKALFLCSKHLETAR